MRLIDVVYRAVEAFGFNPSQARIPEGNSSGGQWINTPSDALGQLTHILLGPRAGMDHPEKFVNNSTFVASTPTAKRLPSMERESTWATSLYQNDENRHRINGALRAGTVDPATSPWNESSDSYFQGGEFDRHDDTGIVRAMDAQMAQHAVKKEALVYRGLTIDPGSDFSPGTRWKDKSYVSATSNERIALVHAKDSAEAGIPTVLDVIVPPGTHFTRGFDVSAEVILERNLTYEVVSNHDGRIVVRVVE